MIIHNYKQLIILFQLHQILHYHYKFIQLDFSNINQHYKLNNQQDLHFIVLYHKIKLFKL